MQRIQAELKQAQIGIVCLTHDNFQTPWLLFEAGAVAIALGSHRVLVPYAVDALPDEADRSPLAMFQRVRSDHDGTYSRVEAVARAAFLEYLNHKDFRNFEGIHTRDFVKHYNNAAPEDLPQEMEDAKAQFVSSSDLAFSVNWMIAEGDEVAVCFTAKGTHDGVFQGIPPTG